MTELYFKVRPGSDEVKIDTENSIIRMDLTEPAENGRANTQLLSVIKEHTGLEASIMKGHRSRRKKLRINMDEGKLREELEKKR